MSTQTYVQYALMQLTIDFGAKRAVTGSVGGHKRSSSKHVTLVELAKRLRQLKGTLDLLELEGGLEPPTSSKQRQTSSKPTALWRTS